MSFFSKLFTSKKSNTLESNVSDIRCTQDCSEHVLEKVEKLPVEPLKNVFNTDGDVDEFRWHQLSNGIKIKNDPNMKGTLGDIFQKDISELGYNGGELYPIDNLNTNPFIVGYFQLLTNKLVGICRNDEEEMSTAEIETFVAEYAKLSNYEEENLLKEGIQNHNISQEYIETIFKKEGVDGILENDRFRLYFKNGFLIDYCRIDKYSAAARDYLPIESYYEEAENWFHADDKEIINEINFQAICLLHLDVNIIKSFETKECFLYPNGCCNYIAMAAYYKSYNVQIEEFINSTHGHYEYISKDIKDGIDITKIKAYNRLYVFYNGYTISPNTVDWNNEKLLDNEIGENGFVYVMVNPSIPDLVKIGMTTKDPNERAKELSSATGVPTPFILVYYKPFKNCYLTEQKIHQFLESKGYRVKSNREFFSMPTNLAINVVQRYYELEQEEGKANNI